LGYGVTVFIKIQSVKINSKNYSFKSGHGSTVLMCGLVGYGLFLCLLIYVWMQLWRLQNGGTWRHTFQLAKTVTITPRNNLLVN